MQSVPAPKSVAAARSMPRRIPQNSEAIPVLGLTDLTPREACGQHHSLGLDCRPIVAITAGSHRAESALSESTSHPGLLTSDNVTNGPD